MVGLWVMLDLNHPSYVDNLCCFSPGLDGLNDVLNVYSTPLNKTLNYFLFNILRF